MTDTKNSDDFSAALPSAPVGSAAAAAGGGDFAAGSGRMPDYPVPGRSPEYNRRVAGHEIGHAFVARAQGSTVHFVTIVPGRGYEGRCVRSGPPSQLNLDESPELETNEIVDICSRLEKLTPEIGSGRVESAEFYIRAQVAAIELVGGRVAEGILHPDLPPLPAEHDQAEARAFAAVACAAPGAVGALIAYAEAEAEALLRAHPIVVTALVDAIEEKGTLSGIEVDGIIMRAMAAEGVAVEQRRRAAWKRVEQSATFFSDFCGRPGAS